MWESSSPCEWLYQHWVVEVTQLNRAETLFLAAYICLKQCEVTILFPCRVPVLHWEASQTMLPCNSSMINRTFLRNSFPREKKGARRKFTFCTTGSWCLSFHQMPSVKKTRSFSDTRSLGQDKLSSWPKSHQRHLSNISLCNCSYDKWPMLHKFCCIEKDKVQGL